jgi:predicted RNase H-like HicB family nuclease
VSAVELKLSAVVTPEDDGWVAWCPELEVASDGPTEDEAREALREAVELLLEDMPADELARRYQPGRVASLRVA